MNNLYLKSFIRCRRKAWLDFQGNNSLKIWSPHQAIEIVKQHNVFFKFSEGDLYAGTKACNKGSKGVIGLTIKEKLIENVYAKVYPQLLVKIKGESKWGQFKYIPAVFKMGHRTTREHLSDLTLCAIMLETFQNSKINKGLVISNYIDKINIEKIDLNKKLRQKVLNNFLSLNQTLKGRIPEITEDRKKCTICSWQNFCNKEAKENGFLTDIDGIGSKTASILIKNGISNINELADSKKNELGDKISNFKDDKYKKADKFINQAKSYISGNPIKLNKVDILSNLFFKKDSGFFVFDIESNPDEKHDFLYGFLTIKNLSEDIKEELYEPIFNINKKTKNYEQKIKSKLFSEKDWPVLHYGETEKIAIVFLLKKLNCTCEEIESIKSRFLDLHNLIRKAYILPIKNYTLKTVASWTGFEWEQKNVSGSKALYWWIQYQITRNDIFLKKIVRYNKDDCLATLHIAKWLVANEDLAT